MPNCLAHAPEQRFIYAVTLAVDNTYDSTHVFY
jgi:hypothetical protein